MSSPVSYLLDTNIIRPLFNFYYPPELFPEIWNGINELSSLGRILSVEEVHTECKRQLSNSEDALKWLDDNKSIFSPPTSDELGWLTAIFSHKEFQMSEKDIEKGKTKADAMLVARGISINATVVTAENVRAHGSKIPTMCARYEVPCISRIEFLKILRDRSYL